MMTQNINGNKTALWTDNSLSGEQIYSTDISLAADANELTQKCGEYEQTKWNKG